MICFSLDGLSVRPVAVQFAQVDNHPAGESVGTYAVGRSFTTVRARDHFFSPLRLLRSVVEARFEVCDFPVDEGKARASVSNPRLVNVVLNSLGKNLLVRDAHFVKDDKT